MDHNKLWKIPQETGILNKLTCLLRNLYAGQEATVKTGHGKRDWFQIGRIQQGCRVPEKISISALLTMTKPLTLWITTNWKILKEMEIPNYLTCLLRNLYMGQEAQLEPYMEQQTGSKLGIENNKAVYCLPVCLIYMQSKS